MSKLKPCPFCGETATLDYSVLPFGKHWFITCDCCGMMYQDVISQRKYVKGGWNTRPIEDALRKRIAELEAEQRWIPVQDIMVGEIYLIDGYDEWDSDRGTEVLDGFTIAKYYGIEDSSRVFADFYGTFLRFDMESDDLRNVYRLPEGA